jgi:ABC-type transport system involved in multi-copper enzyme maturation permease subunit
MTLFFGAFKPGGSHMLGDMIYTTADVVMWIGSLVAVLMGVVITSSFIPSMLRKGTIDLLLVKPLHRWALMVYKYIGGLTFIFLVTAFSVTGIWFVMGVRSGLWAYQILLIIPGLTFFFAILYAISTFVGVTTRSTIACILLTIAGWFVFFLVGFIHEKIQQQSKYDKEIGIAEGQRSGDGAWGKTFAAIHLVTPRTRDLDRLNSLILYCSFVTGDLRDLNRFNDAGAVWWESLLVSGVWIGIFLGASCLWFSTTDY